MTLDPETVERFRADLLAITGEVPTPARKLGLAVSGGPDSMALLLLAAAACPGAIAAATVDHGFRLEARAEAEWVGSVCAELGVPHVILGPADSDHFTGNLQEQARLLRYRLLNEWAVGGPYPWAEPWRASFVATAHQRDDVAETFLMRARRGAGVGGLAAMAQARPIVPAIVPVPLLIRPLLGWTRAELGQVVGAANLDAVADPSNAHPRFDRSRIRAMLASAPDLPQAMLARSAANLRAAEEALEWMALREYHVRHAWIGALESISVDVEGLPYELRRRLAAKAIDDIHIEHGPGIWRGTGLDRLVAALDAGEAATLASVKAMPRGTRWHFSPAPPRRSH